MKYERQQDGLQQKLNLHVYPSPLIGASRIYKITQSLQSEIEFRETHAVGIRTGSLPSSELIAPNVKIIRLAGVHRKGILGRLLKMALWQPQVYFEYRKKKIATIAAHNVWVLPLCHVISRSTGALLIYNPHELETETVAMRGFKQKLAKWIERRYVPTRVSLCSAVNRTISDWYANTYRISPPVVVTNIPIDGGGPPPGLRHALAVPAEEMLYVHTGNLAPGRNIEVILRVFAGETRRHVVFIGDGPLRDAVQAASTANPNIHWHAPVPSADVVRYVRECDVALSLIEQTSLSLRYSTPNKLFEALASSTPVLSTDLPEVRVILGESARRWIVDDVEHDLAQAIRDVSRDDIERFAKDWTGIGKWSEQVEPLVDGYRRLLNSQLS